MPQKFSNQFALEVFRRLRKLDALRVCEACGAGEWLVVPHSLRIDAYDLPTGVPDTDNNRTAYGNLDTISITCRRCGCLRMFPCKKIFPDGVTREFRP